MQQQPHATPSDELQNLLTRLSTEHYSVIEKLGDLASIHIIKLQEQDVHATKGLYLSLCEKLISQSAQYLRLRRQVLLPYVQELLEKKQDSHDCRNCTSSCTVRHGSQILGIREAHQKMKETLYRLQSVALPLYNEAMPEAAYRALRNEMMLLDTALTELFFIEESSLIPKVLEAQKDIHARR